MISHQEQHPLAGQSVTLKDGIKHPQYDLDGSEFVIEDWWDHLTGGSWMYADGNPACLIFAMRVAFADLPTDNEVIYGKFEGMGVLIHTSEIGGTDVDDKKEA